MAKKKDEAIKAQQTEAQTPENGETPQTAGQQLGKVTVLLNFRKEPDLKADVITTLPKGTVLEILENEGIWLKVKHGDAEGYVMAQYIEAGGTRE